MTYLWSYVDRFINSLVNIAEHITWRALFFACLAFILLMWTIGLYVDANARKRAEEFQRARRLEEARRTALVDEFIQEGLIYLKRQNQLAQ